MKILVIGTGYVGTTTALVFAEMGYKVTGLDADRNNIDLLGEGTLYFYEPGLESILVKHLQEGNIKFTTDSESAIKEADIIFICTETPSGLDGSADLQNMKEVSCIRIIV
ncbi:3-hydroxyacyl-CoA dehydrogenase NAD-binding domain-containing protein [Paenibacillus sediminis]|uniref:UDP-glucose 6-dehydrogenase n=1 Tax=Paenibacillus sediminis TaxID=664909 RepID=A0ABS4H676_9BACL|nr:UDP-glucose 6-dehydrogenase [Paenibacillus sediminis]